MEFQKKHRTACLLMAESRIDKGEDPELTENQISLFLRAKGYDQKHCRWFSGDIIREVLAKKHGFSGDCGNV